MICFLTFLWIHAHGELFVYYKQNTKIQAYVAAVKGAMETWGVCALPKDGRAAAAPANHRGRDVDPGWPGLLPFYLTEACDGDGGRNIY